MLFTRHFTGGRAREAHTTPHLPTTRSQVRRGASSATCDARPGSAKPALEMGPKKTAGPTTPDSSALRHAATASSPETAQRIMAHMNADHADSLARYIQHFGGVWAISARQPEMVRLSRASMTIASTGPVGASFSRGLHTTISFEPALAAGLGDARKRLIDMDEEARRGLGREDVTVRQYRFPTSAAGWAWWAFVAGAWWILGRRANLFEGAWFCDHVLARAPTAFVVVLRAWQARIFYVMLGLHALETLEMAVGKMRAFNVELASPVWCAWVASVAFEGFPVWARLDRVVQLERDRMIKTMH